MRLANVVVMIAVIVGLTGLLLGNATAETMQWDTSTDAGFQAGNGKWDSNNTAMWSIATSDGTAPGMWTSGADDAVFGTSGTSAVTVSGPSSVHGMTISGTGYTISGALPTDLLTIGAGGIIANETVTIVPSPALSASQSWTVAAGKHLYFDGNVAIDVGAANTLTIDGLGTVRNAT